MVLNDIYAFMLHRSYISESYSQEIIEPLIGSEGLRIAMRGLEYMNDDPSEVDVLYAQIQMLDGSEKLQVSTA